MSAAKCGAMTRTASAATRTPERVRVVVSVTSDEHTDDELSALLQELLLHSAALCIRLHMRRRAFERMRVRIIREWREDFDAGEAAE
jgi:hypothetical protein